ncbi:uncharacterized protein N7482_001080 [Penicillium canariense]|uniref:Uncharacterized protein n=1 Tax=Penicillium canariense TaxID=189055 RepID=A0A9W9LSK8_9EURO|nr:uncharacterized protein N7482_001080 [Penicillium canariense]KAJ5175203.1 hypothetical protein N7482_001080 [Penicillium canariense]
MHANHRQPRNPTVTGGLLYLFSRKERAKRKQQTQAEQLAPLQVPPAYQTDFYEPLNGPRSAHPRPLSSFAPDASRQAHYGHYGHYPHPSGSHYGHLGHYGHQDPYRNHSAYPQQLPRASFDSPPRYPALPTYDPSRYQPIGPSLTPTADRFSFNHPNARGQTRLSEVHYPDARPLSIYQPPPVPDLAPAPPIPQGRATHARTKSIRPFPAAASAGQRSFGPGEGRERSISEPMPAGPAQGSRGSRRPKPVLSRLVTNFG